MAHPAFIDIPDTDIDVDSPLTTTIFQNFRQCDRAVRVIAFGFDVAEVTFTSATYVTVATVYFYLPDLADFDTIQRRILANFEVKTSAGGTLTLKTTADGVDSDEVTTTSTSYTSKTCTQNLASGLKGTIVQLDIKGKISAGTGYLRSIDRLTTLLEY